MNILKYLPFIITLIVSSCSKEKTLYNSRINTDFTLNGIWKTDSVQYPYDATYNPNIDSSHGYYNPDNTMRLYVDSFKLEFYHYSHSGVGTYYYYIANGYIYLSEIQGCQRQYKIERNGNNLILTHFNNECEWSSKIYYRKL